MEHLCPEGVGGDSIKYMAATQQKRYPIGNRAARTNLQELLGTAKADYVDRTIGPTTDLNSAQGEFLTDRHREIMLVLLMPYELLSQAFNRGHQYNLP